VVDVGDELVLVHVVDPAIVLDGFQALRIRDLTDVNPTFATADFVVHALRLRRQRPRCPPGIRLSSLRSLIESAGARFPLIALHQERDDNDSCWIGRLVEIDDLRVTIDYLTPTAKWEGQERYALRSLTKIEFGGRYEDALASVAGGVVAPGHKPG